MANKSKGNGRKVIRVTPSMVEAGAWKLAQLTAGGLTREFVVFEVFAAMIEAQKDGELRESCPRVVRCT